ncbi:uncharacterized protein N7458_009248 [Penicillium daleae]|uniref:Uncharacterized protein n=1 Tax=Penicillium daleae TaxID=63821 RepID=A0AAD6FY79_9EURO|nr:uncharacterized protein N7458_009248 [Penicillium daleae]KAJ5438250.1 hypothetical protein N7458_009248 [Penicillium daleae]
MSVSSYHSWAPLPKSPLEYPTNALYRISETQQRVGDVFCLAPVDKDHPENYVRWLKFQILLYRLDGDYGHIMNPGDCIVIAEQNPSTARPEGLQRPITYHGKFSNRQIFST